MKLHTYEACITECFNGVMFETEDGVKLAVSMRDFGYEIAISQGDGAQQWFYISDTELRVLGSAKPLWTKP